MCACRGCGAGKQLQVSAHGGWRRLAWRGEQASRQTGRLLPHNKLAEGDTVPPAPGIIWPDPGLVRSTHGALRAAGCSLNSQREPAPSHEDGGVRGVVPGASRRAAWPLHTGSRSSFQARAWPLLGVPPLQPAPCFCASSHREQKQLSGKGLAPPWVPLCSQHPAFVQQVRRAACWLEAVVLRPHAQTWS